MAAAKPYPAGMLRLLDIPDATRRVVHHELSVDRQDREFGRAALDDDHVPIALCSGAFSARSPPAAYHADRPPRIYLASKPRSRSAAVTLQPT